MAKKPADKEKVSVEIENITRIRVPKEDIEAALKKAFNAPDNASVSWMVSDGYDTGDVYSCTIEYRTTSEATQ